MKNKITKTLADLIVNMTLSGATRDELKRAIRYSLDVIDSGKENNVPELIEKYC